MQSTARKVLEAISGTEYDPSGVQLGGDRSQPCVDPATPDELPTGLTSDERRWMFYLAQVTRLSAGMRRLKTLSKLACRIEQLEERYRQCDSWEGSIPEPFFTSWMLTHVSVGPSNETLATIIAEILKALDAPRSLVATADTFAASYCGFYAIVERRVDLVLVEELVTHDRFAIRTNTPYPAEPGTVWWVRLLPNPDGSWTALGPPHVFGALNARDGLAGYFRRTIGAATPAAYRYFLRCNSTPEHWFEFMLDAFAGYDGVVHLQGVPDRPLSLPQLGARERRHDPRPGARSALLAWADRAGWLSGAVEAFREARQDLGLEDQPPSEWSEAERTMAKAYAMYGHFDDLGRTALDVALNGRRALFGPAQYAQLQSVRAGWFSVFEVTGISLDEGLMLRDVLRRRRLQVSAKSATRRLMVGDVVAGWVTVEPDESLRLEGAYIRAPETVAPRLIETMRHLNEMFREGLPELPAIKRLGLLAPYAAAALVRVLEEQSPRTAADRSRSVETKRRRRARRATAHQLALFDMSALEIVGPRHARM